MATKQEVNVSQSPRLQQNDFSEAVTDITLGPPKRPATVDGEAIEGSPNSVQTVNQWVAMTQADQGLLDAIYNFINTTKEGKNVSPDLENGREKLMIFNFYGNIGKSIKPGEIGQFQVVFSYKPRTRVGAGSPLVPGPVSTRNPFTQNNLDGAVRINR